MKIEDYNPEVRKCPSCGVLVIPQGSEEQPGKRYCVACTEWSPAEDFQRVLPDECAVCSKDDCPVRLLVAGEISDAEFMEAVEQEDSLSDMMARVDAEVEAFARQRGEEPTPELVEGLIREMRNSLRCQAISAGAEFLPGGGCSADIFVRPWGRCSVRQLPSSALC